MLVMSIKMCDYFSELCFEKAYCEYRLNRTNEAVTTLRTPTELDNRCKELLAQVVSHPLAL